MKFIIATGGTGGHLFPALKVANELKDQGHEILFAGSFDRSKAQIHKSGFPFQDIGAKGLVLGFRKEAVDSLFAMARAVRRAMRCLREFKPDAVIGFGGYGAFPVILSAVLLRCPTLIHEQNVVPGRANAILSKFVKKIAISFKKSGQYFNVKKTVLTGCPCLFPLKDVDRSRILDELNLQEGKTTILVFGGSQGSRRINQAFMEASKSLKEKLNYQVIHLSGRQDYQKLQNHYHQLGIPFALFEFFDRMERAYYVADLVISRSGAVTVNEVASFQLPAIFIPYPFARGHQKENASVLCDAGVARLIEDKNLSAQGLNSIILEMTAHSFDKKNMQNRFQSICFPDAAQRVAKEALQLK